MAQELTAHKADVTIPVYGTIADADVYLKEKADAVLAEKDAEIRRLRRLLWHAISLFCARSCEYFNGIMSHCLMGQDDLHKRCEEKKNKYLHAMYKCRAKAEEYK